MGILASLLGISLIGTIMILVVVCFKFHKQ